MNNHIKMPELVSDSKDIPGFHYTKRLFIHDRIFIGDYTYGVPDIEISRIGGEIHIGKFCSIANKAKLILNNEHRTDWISTYPFVQLKSDWPKTKYIDYLSSIQIRGNITIGNDVWIGQGSTIYGGATIGDGAIIGANATVAGIVPPYSIVIGNPCRVIRKRFNDDIIEKLLALKWWDWPIERIQECADLLASDRIDELLNVK